MSAGNDNDVIRARVRATGHQRTRIAWLYLSFVEGKKASEKNAGVEASQNAPSRSEKDLATAKERGTKSQPGKKWESGAEGFGCPQNSRIHGS